jgi:EAL domain-containing protein (putative c-di-GMP-specific phosphodiesterase class I)
LRWRHPTRGVLAPFLFVPFAETTGLMDQVTRWVFATAIRQLREWMAAGVQVGMAINLSARNLANAAIADELTAICREAGVMPDLITLELTESAAMSSLIDALEVLSRLRIGGMHLSLDDFGTGYSSLVQLHRLPFSEVKIDRAFTSDCHVSPASRVIVKAMIDLAHNLGLACVAEGVEAEDGLALLDDLHCDVAQGFLIARPMAAAKFPLWLQQHAGPLAGGGRQHPAPARSGD